ncbi:MAG: DUF1223 domain-containing protein [Rhodospirillales bacterium]|nr:DUF1223 domain-containing protein [Rhodospirillales bacterium]
MFCWVKSFTVLTLFAAIFTPLAGDDAVAGESPPLTVVELFTSQGCSSCPPADTYLGDLAKSGEGENVLALSYHVDYWDNLGWKDPYSSADNSNRQRAYAHHMDLRYVYTPQMVVQGALQATGSDRRTVASQIKEARKLPRIYVELVRNGNDLQIALADTGNAMKADVYMVVFDNEHVTKVKKGENRGKTITNRNVVRALKHIGTWQGEAVSISSPLDESGDACAVIVQSRTSGAILGAASVALN